MPKIELMVPAGNFAALQAGLDNGADAIYFGIEQLNMRSVSSANFSISDLPEIIRRSKDKGIKTYLTMNTIVYDHDLNLMRTIIDAAVEVGVDAVIVADQAVMMYAQQKGLPIHISTQVNITNIETIKFYAHFADTMVLSRELGLSQIQAITKQISKENVCAPDGKLVRIEVFGHGALCMAVSGKCYLSLHTHSASANRGACRQNCRKKYYVTDEDGKELLIDNEYIMSPKDLCTLPFLDRIIKAGINVLKIEGRGRAADYVATTVRCYREAIDAYYEGTFSEGKVQDWLKRMKTVYNRDFWGGYYLGQELGEWTENHPGSQATRKKIYVGKGEKYYNNLKVAQFKLESYAIKEGDKMLIVGPNIGVKEFILEHLKVNNRDTLSAKKGEQVTFPFPDKIGSVDKLYKLVEV